MLGIFRRHLKHCAHRKEGRKYLRCNCPVWVDGHLRGAEIHKSLGTSEWQKAQQMVRDWDADDECIPSKKKIESITLQQAWLHFDADLVARNLHPSTIRKYRLLSRQMREFALQRGLRLLKQFDLTTLSEFRAKWQDGPLSRSKKLERLRAFIQFALDNNWVNENPARKLKGPRVPNRPTLPFTQEEMVRILGALDPYVEQTAPSGKENARRLRALVLVLRYSGMRIGDVVKLTVDKLKGNKLLLYTQKTGVPVNTVLPDFVVSTLDTVPPVNEKHFFWAGAGNLDVIVGSWQKRLRKLFWLAKVTNGHAHRFRDTLAIELLLAGIPMERVSVLLGHQSVRISEKHYSPWVKSRQDQLEADLERAWSRDPIVLLEQKLHGGYTAKPEAVN